MPIRFWDEAFLTSFYLINRLPTRILNHTRPLKKLLNTSPDYSMLHTFGCACWPNLHPYNSRKLDFHSTLCIFLGYSNLHKGYKCLNRSTGRVYVSRDVVFDETRFPFSENPTHTHSAHTNGSSTATLPPLLLTVPEPATIETNTRFNISGSTNAAASSDNVSTNCPGATLSHEHGGDSLLLLPLRQS